MKAIELNGANIGNPLTWARLDGGADSTGGDAITMITHKKNGKVLVRYGKRNAQVQLSPNVDILSVIF